MIGPVTGSTQRFGLGRVGKSWLLPGLFYIILQKTTAKEQQKANQTQDGAGDSDTKTDDDKSSDA